MVQLLLVMVAMEVAMILPVARAMLGMFNT